jgi:hypothetical protein
VAKNRRNFNSPYLTFLAFNVHIQTWVLKFTTKKVCTACSRTIKKSVPLTNFNNYLYNDKSEMKVKTAEKKSKKDTETISELIEAACASVGYVYFSCTW